LHFKELNPHIDVDDFPAVFPTESVALPKEKALVAGLSSFGFGGTNAHVIVGEAPASSALPEPVEQPEKKEKKVAFLFTGQSSQYVGMGKELYEKDDTFRAALDRCAELSKDLLPTPLFDVIFAKDSTLLDQTQYSQPAIFSIEYALSEMWKAKGVTPAYVLGHSVGEFAAAVTAGIMSVEDGMRLIAARGRLMTSECKAGVGVMKAVFSPQADVEKAIDAAVKKNPKARELVAIAGINGPKMCVVSGDKALVEQVCEATGATSKALNVSHAFHSPLMAPMLEPFRAEVNTATLKEVSGTRMISTLKGAEITKVDADYWVDHVKSAVRFLAGMKLLEAEGVETYLEIGPTPTLLGMGKRCFTSAAEWIPSIDKGKSDMAMVAKAADSVCVPVTRPPLVYTREAFPWQEVRHPLMGKKQRGEDGSTAITAPIRGKLVELLSHHIIFGEIVVPGATYLEMVMTAGDMHLGGRGKKWYIENVGFANPLTFRLAAPDRPLKDLAIQLDVSDE
jgi:acyl transferase domain-containing protein